VIVCLTKNQGNLGATAFELKISAQNIKAMATNYKNLRETIAYFRKKNAGKFDGNQEE
jgi:hypothetical protein